MLSCTLFDAPLMSEKDTSGNHISLSDTEDEISILSSTPVDKEQCSICLENYKNKSFLNDCFHSFCYFCILQWSEVSTSCPLCKRTFRYVLKATAINPFLVHLLHCEYWKIT